MCYRPEYTFNVYEKTKIASENGRQPAPGKPVPLRFVFVGELVMSEMSRCSRPLLLYTERLRRCRLVRRFGGYVHGVLIKYFPRKSRDEFVNDRRIIPIGIS